MREKNMPLIYLSDLPSFIGARATKLDMTLEQFAKQFLDHTGSSYLKRVMKRERPPSRDLLHQLGLVELERRYGFIEDIGKYKNVRYQFEIPKESNIRFFKGGEVKDV